MQRSHLMLGLALVAALWGTQCNSLSDDCKKTLTCPNDAGAPRINLRTCIWEFPDGGVWKEGPRKGADGNWTWPNGEPAPAFECSGSGQGGSGGSDNCTDGVEPDPPPGAVLCDPLYCETGSDKCVQCLNDMHCSNAADAGAAAALVCDPQSHRCIECLNDLQCAGTGKPFCQQSRTDSSLNKCVTCVRDSDCGDAEVCDEPTGECTLRCTRSQDCPVAKPVCNRPSGGAEGVCVECLDDSTCSGGTPECNTNTKKCVQCTTDAPCGPLGRVCDTDANQCVRCLNDTHCSEEEATQRCEPVAHTCVECLSSADCTDVAESRCNPGTHTCESCTLDNQCENDAKCRTSDGRCVECTADAHCQGDNSRCETTSGRCVECTADSDCPLPDAARCDLAANSTTRFTCVGCNAADGSAECSGKTTGTGAFCRNDGLCVNCLNNADCSINGPTLSKCNNPGNGNCAACTADADCDLFATENRRACRVNPINPGCVECVNNNHCIGNPDGPRCKTTGGGSNPINTCVECLINADCTDPTKSFCEDNQCVPCIEDAECSHLAGLGVCDTSGGDGVCVECTGPKRQACGANVCNSLAKVCTSNGVGTAGLCAACVSDDHCPSDARCVEEPFPGVADGLYFCVPVQAAGVCPRGFAQPQAGTPTIDTPTTGQTASVCLTQTTCAAYNHYLGARSCLNAMDSAACGIAGVSDGVCVQSTTGFVCSIPCDGGTDCLALCDPTGAFCQP